MYVLSKFNACNTNARTHTHARTHARTHRVVYHDNVTEEKVYEKRFSRKIKRPDKGRKTDRNRKLVQDNLSLVRERALTVI